MADKCIGTLTLDTKKIDDAVKHVNEKLKELGVGVKVEMSKQVSAEIKKQLAEIEKTIESGSKKINDASEKAVEAINKIGTAKASSQEASLFDKLEQKVLAFENKMQAEADKTLAKMEANAAKEAAAVEKAEERKRAAREKEERRYQAVWDKINYNERENQKVADIKAQEQALSSLVDLYVKYYALESEKIKAVNNGDIDNADIYRSRAQAIWEEISAIEAEKPKLAELAGANDKVTEAVRKWQSVANAGQIKSDSAFSKQRIEDINTYKDALVSMMNEQAKFNQQVASGKLVEGTEQYTQAEEKLRNLESAAISAGQKLDESGRNAAMGMQQVQTALDNVKVSMAAINDSQQTSVLTQVENAYKQLTTAIRNYQLAKRANNEEGMASQQAEINNAMQIISSIDQIIGKLNIEDSVRDQIRAKIEQAKIAQDAHAKGIGTAAQATGELESQVKGLVTRYLSLMAVIRMISNLMNNMVEYVAEYSDKMNEIQMITMKTDAEVADLAKTYRDLAKDMSVSSLDMADAAIYFTRQGLGAAEIENRLKNVTMYAKAANVEFKDASEIITAVVNSMGLVEQEAEDGREAAQRVADVFLNIGDHAATSGQEIGEAMQKAAASAGAFGVSMEWLAAYIATVSETTRQEARTIGTAFNTIIARLHQIKTTGYNQEDETKINDIAKALSKIDITLMDQEGNWRDMEVILEEIAGKWGTLDGKTKSYIATTMAGVKQQNVFLALMNDMSKGVEGNSRAFELHELAMNSDGVAAEKYAVYLDSVTAAQERLKVAQEEFYSILSEDVLKGWYNSLAQIVGLITSATEAMGGLNIILPIVAGAVILLGKGIASLAAQITIAGSASQFFATVWEAHPVLLVITGVAAAIIAITTAVGLFTQANESMAESFNNANQKLSESQTRLESLRKAQEDASDMFDDFSGATRLTSDDLDKYNTKLDELAKISPIAKHVVDELKSGFITQEEAAEKLNAELERLIENENQISMRNLISRYTSYQPDDLMPQATSNLLNMMDDKFIQGISNGDPQEVFKRALQHAYMSNSLGDDLQKYIKDLADEYSKAMSNEQVWDTIAGDMAYKLFGTFNVPDDITKNLVDQINNEIDYVLSIVGKDMDFSEITALRISLMNAILGDDGELSTSEFGNFNNVISKWLLEFGAYGKDKIIEEIGDLDIAKSIAEAMFGTESIGTLFEDAMEVDEGFAKGFIDSYKNLIRSGFSEEEVKNIFADIPQSYWNEAADILKERMQTSLQEAFGTDFLGTFMAAYDENGEYLGNIMDSLLWQDIDLSTMKSIIEMAEAGAITLDDVNQLMLDANGDVNVFVESLKNYKKEVGFSSEETEDFGDSIVTMSDKVKKVQAGIKDLRALDAAIKDVQENGADANLSDVFGLAELHPELLTVIGDSEALLAMLQKIRSSAAEDQRGLFKSILLGDEGAMAGSKYADTGARTLGDYRASLTNDEEIAAFDAELEAWIDNLMKANEDFKAAQKEEAEAAKEATKSFSEAVSEVEKLDKILTKIQDNKAVDFSDIIGLSTAHPELVAFANDEEKLINRLTELRNEAQENVRQSVKDAVLDSEEYMKANYAEFYGENTKTLREYLKTLDDEGKAHKEIDAEIDANTEAIVKLANETATAEEETKEATKTFNEMVKEVEKIDGIISKIESNKGVDFSDIIDLSTAHPEIVAFASDADKLLEILQKIKAENKEGIRLELEKSVVGNKEWFENWKRENGVTSEATNASDYMALLNPEASEEDAAALTAISDAVKTATENLVDLSETLTNAGESATEATKAFNSSVKEVEMLDKTIQNLRDKGEVDFSDIINLSSAHPEIVAFANDKDKLLAYLQEIREQAKQSVLDTIKDAMLDSKKYMQEAYPELAGEYETMRDYLESLDEGSEEYISVSAEMDEAAGKIADAATKTEEAAATWLQAQALIAERDMEVNWAKSNNFEDQIRQLQGSLENDGIESAITLFNSWSEEMRKAIGSEYPEFIIAMGKAEAKIKKQGDATAELTEETKELMSALDTASRLNEVKYFKDSAKAIKELSEGTISATDAYDVYTKEINKVTKAYEDILDVQNKMAYNAKEVNKNNQQSIDEGDVSNLAAVLNMTTDQVLADFPAAVDMFNQLTSSAGELADMLNLLNDVAFIRITGTSDADFSAMEAGLIYVQNLADEAVKKLLETGQWEVETIQMNQQAALWNWDNDEKTAGHWSYPETIVGAQVLKPTGTNPFKRSSSVASKRDTTQKKSSGGGGGGGSNKNDDFRDKNVSTEVEKMLDLMKQVMQLQQFAQNFYQAQQKYYSSSGQIQGVINYMKLEKDSIQDQNKILEENIKRIEEQMNAKRAELAMLSTSDARYNEVADDLDKLQKAHQDYTLQVINNNTAINNLNNSIKEQQNKIRQMEINLENEILQAIKDREQRKKDQLDAEIQMENTILNVIKARYEKERDEIIKTTQLKIDALQKEKELLSEQLRIRREQKEEEDKMRELRELEAKYQRIIADPTRAKEAQQLREQIDQLREEMAWDVAEKEVQAQQDSIDQQITSLEDYIEYVENYYNDLFEHPKKLIKEMREIMKMSQDEIIEWLKKNDENYKNSSKKTQQQMVQQWRDTHDKMKGKVKDYWKEVQDIIAKGDDYIIKFLKKNSNKYREASKKQAAAYVDEWKKQLEDLRKAHEQVTAQIANTYPTIPQGGGSGNGQGGSTGGNGGSTGSGTTNLRYGYTTTDSRGYSKSEGGTVYAPDASSARVKATEDIKRKGWQDRILDYVYRYAKGGIANYTGPAWLDGTPQDPERILSPYQTKLFEAMVKSLEAISTIPVMSMPNMEWTNSASGNPVSVGDIIVNVDNLDTDDDYEELARKVGEVLMAEIGRTAVIGGLHIRSI